MKLGKEVKCMCIFVITIILLSLCTKLAFENVSFAKVQTSVVQLPEDQELKTQKHESQNSEFQNFEVQNSRVQNSKVQNFEVQNSRVQNSIVQNDNDERFDAPRNIFRQPTISNSNIFFFEGTCARNRSGSRQDGDTRIRLDITQACAVESAAKANPDMDVFLFSSCRLDENSLAKSSRMVQEIFLHHKNVFVWHQSLESLFKNTVLEDLFYSEEMFNSSFKTHASDLVRILLLKLFGGIYLDLDFIVLRPLSQLADSFVGLQTSSDANNAVLRFGLDAVGRKVADMALQELKESFDGTVWGYNGPCMISRILRKLCKTDKLHATTGGEECEGFVIYDREMFYAVSPIQWRLFYRDDDDAVEKVFELVQNSAAVHLWNSMEVLVWFNKYPTLWRYSKQPKMILQLNFCPIANSYNRVRFVGNEGVIVPKVFDLHQFLYSL